MKWSYEFDKCIFCKTNPPGNWEHIIPESLGGRLQAKILCVSCNSILGSELIGNLKQNASIRLIMEDLKTELPVLYSKLMDKATFVAKSPDGTLVRVSRTNNGQKVLASKGMDGSLIQDTKEASKYLENVLTKTKMPSDEIKRLKKRFNELEEDIPLDVSDDYTFIKRPLSKFQPELNPDVKIDDRLPTLIAFEFLALLIGNQILSANFDEIRQYIRYGTYTEMLVVEQVQGKKNDTFHTIVVEPKDNTIRFHVRLFRWLTFFVTFKHYVYKGLDSVYIEDLKLRKSLYARTQEEAKQNMWYELK
ncbi:MAG: HNH endonuclease [Chloroflexota bacterium]